MEFNLDTNETTDSKFDGENLEDIMSEINEDTQLIIKEARSFIKEYLNIEKIGGVVSPPIFSQRMRQLHNMKMGAGKTPKTPIRRNILYE